METSDTDTIIALNQRLLESITEGDWPTYSDLSHPSLTAFEPEANGQLVEGLAFHEYYFKLPKATQPRNSTMASPNVRVMGDVAVIAYTRLIQKVGPDNHAMTVSLNETRVWHRQNNIWRHVHFHRSTY